MQLGFARHSTGLLHSFISKHNAADTWFEVFSRSVVFKVKGSNQQVGLGVACVLLTDVDPVLEK